MNIMIKSRFGIPGNKYWNMNGLRNGLCRRTAVSDVTSGQWQRLLRKLGPTLTPEYEYGQLRQLATSLCNAPSWVVASGKPPASQTGEGEFPNGCASEAQQFLYSS